MKFFLIFLLTLSLYAGHDEKKGHHINKDVTHLDLSKEQKEAFKEVLKKFQHEIEEFREFKEDIFDKKRSLFLADTLDIEALDNLNRELYDKANKEENKMLSKIYHILNKEQRVKFVKYLEEWEVE